MKKEIIQLFLEGEDGTVVKLSKDRPTNIGRGKLNDFWIDLPQVSRSHAMIYYNNDHFFIADLESKNGVLVNGKKIKKIQIKTGDIIKISKFKIKVIEKSETPAIQTGELGLLDFSSSLLWIQDQEKSGTLSIENRDIKGDLSFQNGRLIHASSKNKPSMIGEILEKKKLVPQNELYEILIDSKENKQPIGEILVKKGYLTEAELKDNLTKQIIELACSFFYLDTGATTFTEHQIQFGDMVILDLLPADLIIMAVRRIDDLTPYKNILDDRFILGQAPILSKEKPMLRANETNILLMLNNRNTIKQLIEISDFSAFAVKKILLGLLASGFVIKMHSKSKAHIIDDISTEMILDNDDYSLVGLSKEPLDNNDNSQDDDSQPEFTDIKEISDNEIIESINLSDASFIFPDEKNEDKKEELTNNKNANHILNMESSQQSVADGIDLIYKKDIIPAYAITKGMSLLNRPELILVDISEDNANKIISSLILDMKLGNIKLQHAEKHENKELKKTFKIIECNQDEIRMAFGIEIPEDTVILIS